MVMAWKIYSSGICLMWLRETMICLKIVCTLAEIWTWWLLNTSQNCYHLNQFASCLCFDPFYVSYWRWPYQGKFDELSVCCVRCLHHASLNVKGQDVTHYLLTPWSRVLLENLTGSAASQEIPRLFGTRRFLTVPTSARHLSLSWANSIQSPPPTSRRSILILSSHLRLGLPSGLFPSGLPIRTLCPPLPSPIRATCPAHLTNADIRLNADIG